MQKLLETLDYKKFKDSTLLDRIPLVGQPLEILLQKGIYPGDYLESWLAELLKVKGVNTFADLIMPGETANSPYRYKLRVIASDISQRKLLILPQDSADYGIVPETLSVAKAVRMSISIPYFFKPVILESQGKPNYIVDGGLFSNFPVWLFDDKNPNPAWPTFGYKLVVPSEEITNKISNDFNLLEALISTLLEAHDTRYLEDHSFIRTIVIPTLKISGTNFNITRQQQEALFRSGQQSAQHFFELWDFEGYKDKFREIPLGGRLTRLWE